MGLPFALAFNKKKGPNGLNETPSRKIGSPLACVVKNSKGWLFPEVKLKNS
jgi:hypothetical protein